MQVYVNKARTAIDNKEFVDAVVSNCKLKLMDSQQAELELSKKIAKANHLVDPQNTYYKKIYEKLIEDWI